MYEYLKIEPFPHEMVVMVSPILEVIDYTLTCHNLPLRLDDITKIAAEALEAGKRIECGLKNPRIAGFAIANPLRRERTGEIYAVGVYLKYKVLEG